VNLATLGAAFAMGLTTSIGPCMAPRFLALRAIVTHAAGRERWWRVACFMAGLLCAYALLATVASLVWTIAEISRYAYLALGTAFSIVALRMLTAHESCAHETAPRLSRGSAFFTGGALGFIVSPCCTPVAAIAANITMAGGSMGSAALAASAFAAGHLAPLAATGVRSLRLSGSASATISAGLSMALACYYWVLA